MEFKLFSQSLLNDSDFQNRLHPYVNDILKLQEFEIVDQENVVIPKSDFPFEKYSEGKHIRICMGDGWVKPSAGYYFKNCERNSSKIVINLKEDRPANNSVIFQKIRFCDSLSFDVLNRQNELGPELYKIICSKHPVENFFAYLENQVSFAEDSGTMAGFPWPSSLHSFAKFISR